MGVKKRRGGKHPRIETRGYYGNNIAGNPRELVPNTAGEFMTIGSGSRQFTFYSENRGTLTVWADSYEEAWRQARTRGYSRRITR